MCKNAPVRRIALVLLAGCSFKPGQAATEPPEPDAPVPPGIDAPAVADWPCGTKPIGPGATLEIVENAGQTHVTLSSITFDGGSPLLVVSPGQTFTMHFDFTITDVACPNACRDQIEVGFVAGARVACAFDGEVDEGDGASGHVDQVLTAPMTGGAVDLRVNLGQNLSCNYAGAHDWWGGAPSDKQAVGKLCVH